MLRVIATFCLILPAVSLQAEDPGKLSLADGDRVVMTYNADLIPSPDTDAPWFKRSGFIHPVYTPSGRVVTEGFPADHLHQHGLMFAWTSSVYDGRPVDFWNSKLQAGHIEHVETIRADDDVIRVRLQHVDDTSGKPIVVLNETWELTRLPHKSMNVFDLVSTQTCVAPEPLEIQEYHYGAMCVRGAKDWFNEPCTMVTSEGKDRKAGNHSRPKWVMMHGKVDGRACGIAAMGHPDNFRAPQPVRLHPNKPYFCFAPMVLGDFSIEPAKPYVSRFRFVAFDGEPDEHELISVWDDFAESVQVTGTTSPDQSASHSDQGNDVFLLPYFLGNGETGVYLSHSRDGLKFEWLSDGEVVMPAPSWGDESLTRDPSILYHDGVFHMIWTTSWNSRSIGYANSTDLVNWSTPKKIDIWGDSTEVRNTWAPELLWDPEQKEFLILWSSTSFAELNDDDGSADQHGYDHRSYAATTRDFETFSKPKLFYSPKSPELSVIDPFITHDDRGTADESDDRWAMVIKNEMPPEQGGKNLRMVFSDRMQGPYGTTLGPPIVGAGTSIVDTMGEGPSLFKYNDLWHLYWDAPGSDFSYCLATSPDLVRWTNRSKEMSLPTERMRHGTVLVVPEHVLLHRPR